VLSPVVNPPAEGVGLDGLWRGWRNLRRAVEDGSDRDARWQMMMASTEGAMAFVKGLGAVHAMSHAAGRLPDLSLHHGTLNAILLPTVLRFNQSAAPDKMERIAIAMDIARSADVADTVSAFTVDLGLPRSLSALGLQPTMIPELVRYALVDLSARSNPRPVTAQDYEQLFLDAM
jgi:alcohol dehydrogenase class IV